MQQVASRPDQRIKNSGAPSRSPVILIVALVLFSMAGLASGFSVGALTKSQPQQTANKPNLPVQPQVAQTAPPQVTKTVDVRAVGVGCPIIAVAPTTTQNADNTTVYTITAQIVDKSINNKTPCGKGNPLQVTDLTCKIWLTKDEQSLRQLKTTSNDILTDINKLQNTFPHEQTNTLLFNGSNQVQDCSLTGTTTWKYSIAKGTDPGTYFVAVLADWKGALPNWAWVLITIPKTN